MYSIKLDVIKILMKGPEGGGKAEDKGNLWYIEWFSYDLVKTREQNRNNKRTEIGWFDWFIEQIQTRVAFVWLSERSGEKTSCPRNF